MAFHCADVVGRVSLLENPPKQFHVKTKSYADGVSCLNISRIRMSKNITGERPE